MNNKQRSENMIKFEQEKIHMNSWKKLLSTDEIFGVERNVNCAKVLFHFGYEMHTDK